MFVIKTDISAAAGGDSEGWNSGYVPDRGQPRGARDEAAAELPPRPCRCQALRSSLAHRWHGVPSCQSQRPARPLLLQSHNGNSMAGAGLKRPVVNEQDQKTEATACSSFASVLMIWTELPSKPRRSGLIAQLLLSSVSWIH